MYLYDDVETIKENYAMMAAGNNSQTWREKSSLFNKKVGELCRFCDSLKDAPETMNADNKKSILIMYNGILKMMNSMAANKNIRGRRNSVLEEMNREFDGLKDKEPSDLMKKIKADCSSVNNDMHIVMIGANRDDNQQIINNLKALSGALEASNQKIYGKPSPQYTNMQDRLNTVKAVSIALNKFYKENPGKEPSQRFMTAYKDALGKLSVAANLYYTNKMNKTHAGEKANTREKTRMELAKQIMNFAEGRALAVIPDNLKARAADFRPAASKNAFGRAVLA